MKQNNIAINTDTIYINYYDIIDQKRVQAIMGICTQLTTQHKPKELYFLFSSPGGSVDAGITLYNAIIPLAYGCVLLLFKKWQISLWGWVNKIKNLCQNLKLLVGFLQYLLVFPLALKIIGGGSWELDCLQ